MVHNLAAGEEGLRAGGTRCYGSLGPLIDGFAWAATAAKPQAARKNLVFRAGLQFDVTKFQTSELLISLRFYFHDV